MKQIKFIASGSNSAFGGFSSGDFLRCSDELADHLVNEARVAEYVRVPEPQPAVKTRRKDK